jgi:hypothetical protein
MTKFSEFNIETTSKNFEGDKIRIERIFNREIQIHDFKIDDSKVQAFKERGADKFMHLQISIKGEKYVVFTAATALMEAIQKVPRDKFPFDTVIINDNKRYKFT